MSAFRVSDFISDDGNNDNEENFAAKSEIFQNDYAEYVREAYRKVETLGTNFKFLYLNDWWKMTGYERYDSAKDQLLKNFVKFLDYDEETKVVGGKYMKYRTTLACMKSMVMMSRTKQGYESRMYFLDCEEKLIIARGLLELKCEELEMFKAQVDEFPNLNRLFAENKEKVHLLEDKKFYMVSEILLLTGRAHIPTLVIANKVAGAYAALYGQKPRKIHKRSKVVHIGQSIGGYAYQRKDWFIVDYIIESLGLA